MQYDFGMIGLGTMGRNLVYNFADHGYSAAGYDKDINKVTALTNDAPSKNVLGIPDLKNFTDALKSPKIIMLLVPAGPIVDAVLKDLKPFLKPDDLVMDCGNSHFSDTDLRIEALKGENIQFMGVGISGGEYGARFGPSIMPGGSPEAYHRVEEMLKAVSAKVNDEPCVSYVGLGSAGHYVKMVHNGIEYALMEIIAEAYAILKECMHLSNSDLHNVFTNWNKGRLQSYLIEITADIFSQKDALSDKMLIDIILDESAQNGTGKWTSQSALDLLIPIPAIDAAVSARDLSSLKTSREAAQKKLTWEPNTLKQNEADLIESLESAVYFASIISYAQGFALMQKASDDRKFGLVPHDIARIWRGGCIIRSEFLEDILSSFKSDPKLTNIILDNKIAALLNSCQEGIRNSIKSAVDCGLPVPVMMASLAYFDSYRSEWLPANLIQAQRDYFGAHTYKRNDREGTFHTQWNQILSDGSNH